METSENGQDRDARVTRPTRRGIGFIGRCRALGRPVASVAGVLGRLLRSIGAERAARASVWTSCAIALAMYVVGGIVIDQSRVDAWQRATDAARNLAMALARDTENRFQLSDEALKHIDARMKVTALQQLPDDVRHLVLFGDETTGSGIGATLILDRSGNVVDKSDGMPLGHYNFADRDYFQVWKGNRPQGLYVSRVYRSRLAGGAPSIALSRRLTSADGKFIGVAMIPVRLAYFERLFKDINLGEAGAVTLLAADGTILVRKPGGVLAAGKRVPRTAISGQIGPAASGAFVARGTIDGVERLYVYQRIAGYGLLITVAPSTQDILAAWRIRAAIVGGLIFLLGAAVVGMATLFSQELRRREAAESKLQALVRSDPLTGLATRRELDTMLEHEWRRARRSGQPLSLLFVDVDYFKRFNDLYGHQAGDRVLKTAAAALASVAQRPSDLAARYGGEEFILLLAETDESGAARAAECVRAAVAARDVVHAGSPFGKLTVSLGLACSASIDADSPAALVAAADRGLYAAKAAGRNCVAVASNDGEQVSSAGRVAVSPEAESRVPEADG